MRAVSRGIFQLLGSSKGLQSIASRSGMRPEGRLARRFVAGETLDQAIEAARTVEARGLLQTLGWLGASVRTMADADAATRRIRGSLDRIADAGIGRNVSVKLTELGLVIDRATCVDNLRRILDAAGARDFFVRIDMEDSRYTQLTLDVFETMWQQGYRHTGPTIQAYLPRSVGDVERLNGLGARVRLVKGAHNEPRRVAYRRKPQVDAAFLRIMRLLLRNGTGPAIATHDATMIGATRRFAADQGLSPDGFEFQLLYGVRRDLQFALAAAGYRVRVYVPFGPNWFPYLMHRLGERPAVVLRSLAGLR